MYSYHVLRKILNSLVVYAEVFSTFAIITCNYTQRITFKKIVGGTVSLLWWSEYMSYNHRLHLSVCDMCNICWWDQRRICHLRLPHHLCCSCLDRIYASRSKSRYVLFCSMHQEWYHISHRYNYTYQFTIIIHDHWSACYIWSQVIVTIGAILSYILWEHYFKVWSVLSKDLLSTKMMVAPHLSPTFQVRLNQPFHTDLHKKHLL